MLDGGFSYDAATMIRITTFAGKTVAVFGLARSGISTARALVDGGASVAAWDDTAASRATAEAAGIPLVDLTAADWGQFAALILSPGVPLTHPVPHWTVDRAKAAGVPVIGDVELFFRERAAHCSDAPVIAITGTNGKSTTTALVAHLLQTAGVAVEMSLHACIADGVTYAVAHADIGQPQGVDRALAEMASAASVNPSMLNSLLSMDVKLQRPSCDDGSSLNSGERRRSCRTTPALRRTCNRPYFCVGFGPQLQLLT